MTKVLKVIAIIAAIAAAIVGIYVAVTKIMNKKQNTTDEENYVSCSCEEEFTSEKVG